VGKRPDPEGPREGGTSDHVTKSGFEGQPRADSDDEQKPDARVLGAYAGRFDEKVTSKRGDTHSRFGVRRRPNTPRGVASRSGKAAAASTARRP